MKSILRRRPSPALVVSIIALLVALGGTAIAANTIRSTDIVNGQVMRPDLANGAVAPAKLAKLPAVDAFLASDRGINPNTPNLVPLDGETFDTANMHSNTGQSQYLRAPVAGIYRATAHVDWVGNGSAVLPSGTECTVVLLLGTPLNSETIASSKGDCSAGHSIEVSRAVRMTARQTLFMVIFQTSGSAFTLDGAANPAYMDLTWVGPGF
jgi:hypothetical protein